MDMDDFKELLGRVMEDDDGDSRRIVKKSAKNSMKYG
jgi:hypothetical protein